MNLLVLSCSLSPRSRSAVLAERLAEEAAGLGDEVEFLDLRTLALPFCAGSSGVPEGDGARVRSAIERADAVALAVPIYNYDVGGAARNLIALTGRSWTGKVVGLLAAAGGQRSYMSLMPLANSLMLDFRCVVVPRFVYASRAAFPLGGVPDPDLEERLGVLARELHRFALAIGSPAPPS